MTGRKGTGEYPPDWDVIARRVKKVVMERIWYLPHSPWFKPYVAGYVAATMLGLDLDRETATRHADALIGLHQGRLTPLECMAEMEG